MTQDLESSLDRRDRLELRAWLRLLTCTTIISARVRQSLREKFATTLPRFDVLAQLARVPKGLLMSELSQRLMVTGGNVTALVDRLETEGHVSRESDKSDRRKQIIRLTDQGHRRFEAMAPAHQTWIDDMLAGMDRQQLENFYALLGALKTSIESASQRPPRSATP